MAGDSYRDGVRRRLLLAVPVALGAALLFRLLDGDLGAAVLVGLVTVLCVALVPRPEEGRRPDPELSRPASPRGPVPRP